MRLTDYDHAARVQSLGWEDFLEKEMATHFSVLAWRIPGTGEPGGLLSMGSHRVGRVSEEGNPAGLSSCSGGLRPLVELCVEPAGLCGRCTT